MELKQSHVLSQKLALTQTMRQSLDCLQLSAPELCEYVQDVALSNPLLDVCMPTYYETELPNENMRSEYEQIELRSEETWRDMPRGSGNALDISAVLTRELTFRDCLNEQIGQMRLVDDGMLQLCRFLIDCLDGRGYLDCPLEELSKEFGIPFFSLEQALYAIQMLDPPGIGARSLSECLILQLVQSRSLDPLTIGIARNGLEQLGRRDYKGLAAMLGAGVSEIKQASAKILALEPIPSRSFASSEPIAYIVPDAAFSVEQSRVTIELNRRVLPRLSVNTEYSALLATSDDPNVQQYVREKLTEANAIIKGVHMRCNTILRLLTLIATEQHDFFCSGGTLTPITMQQMAEKMDMSTSTVSRAIQNKYIQYRGRIVPLRSFFTTAIRSDASVSSQAVRQRIQDLIKTENPEAPLSDESVRIALSALGIEVIPEVDVLLQNTAWRWISRLLLSEKNVEATMGICLLADEALQEAYC